MVKRYEMNPNLSWEQRYAELEKHHIEETTELVEKLKEELVEVERQKAHNQIQQQKNEQIAEAARQKDLSLTTALRERDEAQARFYETNDKLARALGELDGANRELQEARAEAERQMNYGVKQHEIAQDAIRERDAAVQRLVEGDATVRLLREGHQSEIAALRRRAEYLTCAEDCWLDPGHVGECSPPCGMPLPGGRKCMYPRDHNDGHGPINALASPPVAAQEYPMCAKCGREHPPTPTNCAWPEPSTRPPPKGE